MKKWLALLLAILMVLALAACTKTGEKDQPVDSNPEDTTPVEENSYQVVDETVYTATKDVQLYKELDNKTGMVTIEKAATELHRIRVSTKLQASVVEYKGEEYYVSSGKLTTADLYGKKYTAVNNKTMYATADLKVRSCADITLSEVVGVLAKNDEVTVIAQGNGWSKIAYSKDSVSGEYFVSTQYLSEEQEIDYSKVDFTGYFTTLSKIDEKKVLAENLNLRIAPVVAPTTLAAGLSLKKNETASLVAYGKGEYATWGIVLYPDTVKEGETQTYSRYYVKLCATDCSEVYITIPTTALSNQIAKLGFTAKSETLFVNTDKLNLRMAPSLSGNYAGEVKKGDTVQIVASGSVTEPDPDNATETVTVKWAMVKTGDGRYVYASMKFLSGSLDEATGAMTLEQLLKKYPVLGLVEERQITAKGKVICYYDLDKTVSGVELKAGDKVTLVAMSDYDPLDKAVWYVFRMENGAFFCAGKELFN